MSSINIFTLKKYLSFQRNGAATVEVDYKNTYNSVMKNHLNNTEESTTTTTPLTTTATTNNNQNAAGQSLVHSGLAALILLCLSILK